MTIGDVLGWLGVIVIFGLVLSLIYFLIRRAENGRSGTKDESWLRHILNQIVKIDERIRQLLAEVERLKKERDELKREVQEFHALRDELEAKEVVEHRTPTPLLAILGSDEALRLDLAALRAVEAETGMTFQRVHNATLGDIKRRLDAARSHGRPYDKVHMSVHSSPEGILLGGQLVDSVALSEILRGVRILFIAGCESSEVGDFLGVVPFVITMTEQVSHQDAARMTELFWTNIGKHMDPAAALRQALAMGPSGMSEYVERHF